MNRIWLIGGTTESQAIARGCIDSNLPCLVTVTSESAAGLYNDHPLLSVQVGKLTFDTALHLCRIHQIRAIVDASHPFATLISELAGKVAERLSIPSLCYQRPPVFPPPPAIEGPPVLFLDQLSDLLAGEYLAGQRVLLTIGCKALPAFQPWQQRSTLFARVLPKIDSLQVALASGFTPDRLVALRPPISRDLERALWQQWQITLAVTKESGLEGGQARKQDIARELGIPLLIIKRPFLAHCRQTSELREILSFCQQSLSTNHV